MSSQKDQLKKQQQLKRRKQLKSKVKKSILELNIEDKLRPEQVSVDQFCKLANLIYNFKK